MVWHASVIELLALRDGALSEKKTRRLRLHLEACRSCRSKASQIEENLRQSSSILVQDNSVAFLLGCGCEEPAKSHSHPAPRRKGRCKSRTSELHKQR